MAKSGVILHCQTVPNHFSEYSDIPQNDSHVAIALNNKSFIRPLRHLNGRGAQLKQRLGGGSSLKIKQRPGISGIHMIEILAWT